MKDHQKRFDFEVVAAETGIGRSIQKWWAGTVCTAAATICVGDFIGRALARALPDLSSGFAEIQRHAGRRLLVHFDASFEAGIEHAFLLAVITAAVVALVMVRSREPARQKLGGPK